MRSSLMEPLPVVRSAGTTNGATDAIDGHLEDLHGCGLGLPNLTNDIARSLLETSRFRNHLHPRMR